MSNGANLQLLAYLDNGVLSRLLKKAPAEFRVQFDKTAETICRREKRGTVALAHSPALFLELLSITTKPFLGIESSAGTALEWFQTNGDAARAHFESLPELSMENFRAKYECEIKHATDEGKLIFKSLLEPKLNDLEARQFLITTLASQAVQSLPVPAKFRNEVHIQTFVAALASHAEKRHVPFVKVASMIQKEMQRTENWKTLIAKWLQKRISKSLGLHFGADYVDADIIHFACFGYWVGEHLQQVHAFTTDDAEKILDRLAIYKGQIIHFRTWILEENQDEHLKSLIRNFPPLEGAVHILNKDGALNRTIFVADLV